MDFSEDNAKLPIAFPYKPAVEASCALEDPILQYICSKDFVPMMRTVFKAKLFHPISEVYRYTRTYEQGLSVAGYLIETLNECINQVTSDERNEWMMCFLRHQQNQLSKEEIDYRFDRVLQLLKCAYLSKSGSLWL